MNKIKILFWLRKSAANSNGLSPVKIRITVNGESVDFASGYFADEKLWDAKSQKVKGQAADAYRVNSFIHQAHVDIKSVFDTLISNKAEISAEIVRNIFQGKAEVKITILSAIRDHNIQFESLIGKKGYSIATLSKYELLEEKIKEYLKNKNRKDIFATELKYSFIQDFRSFMEVTQGLSPDSATGYLKKLHKIVLNLFDRGHIKINPFIGIKMNFVGESGEALTHEQLTAIQSAEVKGIMKYVKDRFLFGCFTGISHSDISALTKSNIVTSFSDHSKWIKSSRVKTGEGFKVPLLSQAEELIGNYNGKLLPEISINKMNRYLKKLADVSGLENVKLSSHVARHTFSVQALNHGVSLDAISAILGHSNIGTTKKTYAKTSDIYIGEQMKNFKLKVG